MNGKEERYKTLKECLDELTSAPYNMSIDAPIIVYDGLIRQIRIEAPIRWFYEEYIKDTLKKEVYLVDWDETNIGMLTKRIWLN